MGSLLDRLTRLVRAGATGGRGMIGGFVDSLIQTFENSRPGLGDEAIGSGEQVAAFFGEIFERERPRLLDLCSGRETGLSGQAGQVFRRDVEKHLRKVVLPAYVRLARSFTLRERNDFYFVSTAWHGAERLAWAVAGMALGGFVIWAPFIPIWEKEWVAVFALGGLVLPELRRYFALRHFQSELNRLVGRADDEIFRLDMALVGRMENREADDDQLVEVDGGDGGFREKDTLQEQLEDLEQPEPPARPKRRRAVERE